MNAAQVVAVLVVVASAVLAFLLGQSDVTFDPVVKLVLGAANVAVTTLALYLRVTLPGRSTPS